MSDPQEVGAQLIVDLEKARKSKVIVYLTSDRYPFGSIHNRNTDRENILTWTRYRKKRGKGYWASGGFCR